MTDSKNLREGDKVAVNLVAKGIVSYAGVSSGYVDILLAGNSRYAVKVPVEYVTWDHFPVRAGDTWKLNGKLYQVYLYSGRLHVRDTANANEMSINAFEAAGPELVFRPEAPA